jgi:hypothetical protein
VPGDPSGAQHAPEGANDHAGAGPLQRGSGTLRPGPTDVGVVEQQHPCAPERRPFRWRHHKGPSIGPHVCDGRPAARLVGPSQKGRSPARRGQGTSDVFRQTVDESEGCRPGPVGRRDQGHHIDRPTHCALELTSVAEEEGAQKRPDNGAEAEPSLGHRRLLVAEQDRVERARQRAETRRHNRCGRQTQAAGHQPAGEADRTAGRGGAATNAADPGPGDRHAERVRRWERGRADAGERSPWPG